MREDLYYPLFDLSEDPERNEEVVIFSATGGLHRLETMGVISEEKFLEWLDDNVLTHSLAIHIKNGDAKDFLSKLYTEFCNETFEDNFTKVEVRD